MNNEHRATVLGRRSVAISKMFRWVHDVDYAAATDGFKFHASPMNPRMWQCHSAGSFKLLLGTRGLAVSLGANKKFHLKARAWILDVSSYGVADVEIIAAGERESFGCVPRLAVVGRISGEGRGNVGKKGGKSSVHCDRLFASWSSSIPRSDTAIDTYGPQTYRFLARCAHFCLVARSRSSNDRPSRYHPQIEEFPFLAIFSILFLPYKW